MKFRNKFIGFWTRRYSFFFYEILFINIEIFNINSSSINNLSLISK